MLTFKMHNKVILVSVLRNKVADRPLVGAMRFNNFTNNISIYIHYHNWYWITEIWYWTTEMSLMIKLRPHPAAYPPSIGLALIVLWSAGAFFPRHIAN